MTGRGRGNPWNRNSSASNSVPPGFLPKPVLKKGKSESSTRSEVKKQNYSSSEEDDDDVNSESILGKVLQSYAALGGASQDLGRTQLFLEEVFQSGSATCLICISTVGKNDAIWNCCLCYCFFHLSCVQRWAQESIVHQKRALEEQPHSTAADFNWSCPKCRHTYQESEIPSRYVCFCGRQEDPPPYGGWNVPHSCGEPCRHELTPNCGHTCPLLCHPGPCPPCPRQVSVGCQCGRKPPKPVRCSGKVWSCGQPCNKILPCTSTTFRSGESAPVGRGRGKLFKLLDEEKEKSVGRRDDDPHLCMEICHSGPCKPCPRESLQPCRCGKESNMRPCSDAEWQCAKICGKMLACGNHKCSLICHSAKDGCGPCPRSLPRNCACGKASFPGITCVAGIKSHDESVDAVPTCGDTCGRMLACGVHTCARRCHKDDCGACLQMRVQTCRCGQYSKELLCQKEFLCENKCRKTRDCLRHPCSRKCCDGCCPPCDKICSRMLSCGKHRCPAPCHRGPCYPCPLMVTISCPCKSTSIKVPCGQEGRIKGDARRGKGVVVKCRKPCKLPSQCQHPPRPHTCHSGECPSCKEICGIVREGTCGHPCSSKCHSSVWVKESIEAPKKPAGPWEKPQEPKLVKKFLPCPPCTAGIEVVCLGGHEKSVQPCHSARPYPCGRECGRLLPCTSHFCTLPCHHVKGSSAFTVQDDGAPLPAGRNCEACNSACLKPRPIGCIHLCPLTSCHPGNCPPCKQTMKQKCHCGLTPAIFIECHKWVAAMEEDNKSNNDAQKGQSCIEKLLSCGNQCPKLLSCGHRCEVTCHSGPCPADIVDDGADGDRIRCTQKVRVTCPCGLIKQRRICKDVHIVPSEQNSHSSKDRKEAKLLVLLECARECKQRKEEESRAREASAERKRLEEEKRNAEELEKFKLKQEGKRGRARKRRGREDMDDEGNFLTRHWIVISILLSVAAAVIVAFLLMNRH